MDEPLRQNWLRRHRRGAALVSGLMVAALALVNGVGQFATPSLSVPAGEVAVARAERGVFRDMTSLQGQIEPRDIIYLDAAEGGRVYRLFIRSGDHSLKASRWSRTRRSTPPGEIVRLLLWQFLLPVLVACAVGLSAGYAIMRHWLEQFVAWTDLTVWLLAGVAGATVLVAVLVSSAQIMAAARGRIVDALRYE